MSTQHAQCVLPFLVLVVNSDQFQILRSHMLLLQPPVHAHSCMYDPHSNTLSAQFRHVLESAQWGISSEGSSYVSFHNYLLIQLQFFMLRLYSLSQVETTCEETR